jgi:glycosyltransferase involved in cell wall biosynthesis
MGAKLSMRVAVFTDAYLPGFKAGGPIASISRIVKADPETEFRIITRDRDVGDNAPYQGSIPRAWQRVGGALVGYLRPGPRDTWWIRSELRRWEPHFYSFNSLHSPWFTILPLLAIRIGLLPRSTVVLAPRGETSSGALALKSRKKLWWRPVIRNLVGSRVVWQVTSPREAEDVRNWWGSPLPADHRFVVQVNLSVAPSIKASKGPKDDRPVVTFASRIVRKKGLEEAIRILGQVDVPFVFRVAGTIEDYEYWHECQRLAQEFWPQGVLAYSGTYDPSSIQAIFSESSLFIFPTHGENFGHVVAEALSVGCPVVIASDTPWTAVIESGGGHVIRSMAGAASFISAMLTAHSDEQLLARQKSHAAYSAWCEGQDAYRSPFSGLG